MLTNHGGKYISIMSNMEIILEGTFEMTKYITYKEKIRWKHKINIKEYETSLKTKNNNLLYEKYTHDLKHFSENLI